MERIYLYVPFEEKEDVRKLGAHWDAQNKYWFVYPDDNLGKFKRWLGHDGGRDGDTQAQADGYSIVSDKAYVLQAQVPCRHCSRNTPVICIYCESGKINDDPCVNFTVLHITSADNALKAQLERWPFFRYAHAESIDENCFANYCQHCNALQEDLSLHCEPESVFAGLAGGARASLASIPLAGRIQLSGEENIEV